MAGLGSQPMATLRVEWLEPLTMNVLSWTRAPFARLAALRFPKWFHMHMHMHERLQTDRDHGFSFCAETSTQKERLAILQQKKGSMVGFISNLVPLLNYLRRRSPGPPLPPDCRQAGERGAINNS